MLAFAVGLIAGSGDITNTSIGWHVATGRLILDGQGIPHDDPFSFTAASRRWIDHEWGFQTLAAAVQRAAGPTGLVLLRSVLIACLAGLLLVLGLRSGLDPPGALLVSALCVYGAHIRFFIRPELFTLLIAPTVVWLVVSGDRPRPGRLLAVGGLMALGANAHAGVLVVPPLLAIWLAARWLGWRLGLQAASRSPLRDHLPSLAVAAAAPLANPYGWRLYTVPLHIAHLVGLPHIPNPEWISPGPADVPGLYVALVVGLVILAAGRERDLGRWALFAFSAALALRYVRNVGLFFVLVPIAVAPALARLWSDRLARPATRWLLAGAAAAAVGLGLGISTTHHFDLSPTFYPVRAATFMADHDLLETPVYNDVRFGGYLIGRFYPPFRVFIDDRNEIHEPLLRRIHALLTSSDVQGWERMLDGYGIASALLRYNPAFRVVSPTGEPRGERGFSALWFPQPEWALVYWDDTAMVLVKRATAPPALLERYEYRWIRPDDLDHLRRVLAADPAVRPPVAAELARKLAEEPGNRRALALSQFLIDLAGR